MNITFLLLYSVWSLFSYAHSIKNTELSIKLDILKKHYAKYIKNIEGNFIVFINGKKLVINDGIKKTHQGKLINADIEDMLSQVYPVGKCNYGLRSKNMDPGRIRNELFFLTVWGNTKVEVNKSLFIIDWFGEKLKFTKRNNAHIALIKVRDELKKFKNLEKYLTPSAGTFNWRNISGTNRLSAHSFATAIDINIKYSHYWRWSSRKSNVVKPYKNKIPLKIINTFEEHGFIWGGKWYHYDSMHFEYRPEIIEIGKLFKSKC